MAGQAAGALGDHYRRFDIDSESDRNLRRTTAVRRMCSAGPQLQRSARTEVPSLWVPRPSMTCVQRPHTPWANPGRWLSLVGVPSQPLAPGGRQTGSPCESGLPMALPNLPDTVWWSALPLCPWPLSLMQDQTCVCLTALPASPCSPTDDFPNEMIARRTPLAWCPLLGEPKLTKGSEQSGHDLSVGGQGSLCCCRGENRLWS